MERAASSTSTAFGSLIIDPDALSSDGCLSVAAASAGTSPSISPPPQSPSTEAPRVPSSEGAALDCRSPPSTPGSSALSEPHVTLSARRSSPAPAPGQVHITPPTYTPMVHSTAPPPPPPPPAPCAYAAACSSPRGSSYLPNHVYSHIHEVDVFCFGCSARPMLAGENTIHSST